MIVVVKPYISEIEAFARLKSTLNISLREWHSGDLPRPVSDLTIPIHARFEVLEIWFSFGLPRPHRSAATTTNASSSTRDRAVFFTLLLTCSVTLSILFHTICCHSQYILLKLHAGLCARVVATHAGSPLKFLLLLRRGCLVACIAI